jgi:hypothetical protein
MASNSADRTGVVSSNATAMSSSSIRTSARRPVASAAWTRFSVAQPRLTKRWWSSGSTIGVRREKSGRMVMDRSPTELPRLRVVARRREGRLAHEIAKVRGVARSKRCDWILHLGDRILVRGPLAVGASLHQREGACGQTAGDKLSPRCCRRSPDTEPPTSMMQAFSAKARCTGRHQA